MAQLERRLWARVRKQSASFPPTVARMGPGAVDLEGPKHQKQEMIQCEALDQTIPEGEHQALTVGHSQSKPFLLQLAAPKI